MRRWVGRGTLCAAAVVGLFAAGCGGAGGNGGGGGNQNPTTPSVTVTPAATTITTAQSLKVTVTVSGSAGTPSGSVTLNSGAYTSPATTLSGGSATITVTAGALASGSSDILKASYSPDSASSSTYNSASGTATVAVSLATPAVTVTPASSSVLMGQSLQVNVMVTGGSGAPAATGSVVLSSGTYSSAATTISSGSASITIPANTLTAGSATLKGAYTPDSAGAAIYSAASGMSAAIYIYAANTVAVDQSGTGVAVTDQLLGMNLAAWYDVAANATDINTAFGTAGIKAIRWPGGSWSDAYHWGQGGVTPFLCNTTGSGTGWGGADTFAQLVTSIVQAGKYDLALTANYGSNAACTGGGDPTEAAAWAAEAVKEGFPASHMTVGNEEYGDWEYDLHTKKWDPPTYANSVIGANGYYSLIKAASPTTLVGVVVDAGASGGPFSANWDSTVLGTAKGSYDFVEYHYYPQNPGNEDDTYLVHAAPQDLSTALNALKAEMTTAGVNVPIYVGEMGSVSSNPGKQSWSITQGLYAGQTLGEMMNDGVTRATWWIGFGNCNEGANGTAAGNMSSSLYGWQTFGAYNVFSDGPSDGPCGVGSGPIGTMSPTARAFQLFSNVAVTGETVLAVTVNGITDDVRAYAATHSGGTALVLFNLNETTSQPVTVTLSKQSASTDVTVTTYDKAIYNQTNAATPVWASPTTTDMGAQSLPLTLTLTPWSMNVVTVK